MATPKTGSKAAPAKRPAPAAVATPAKTKSANKAKPAMKPASPSKVKAAPKVASVKPAGVRTRKPAGIPTEQRTHYVEMAAYYIAERRGFAPGNPLEDWVQAEAEIDRLLAEGRLGG